MIWWIVDSSVWLYVVLVFAAIMLAAFWWQSRNNYVLVSLLVVFALGLGLWQLGQVVVTDRMRLRRATTEMANAITNNKPEAVEKHISQYFDYRGVTKDTITDKIRAAIVAFDIEQVIVFNYEVEKLSRQEKFARISFRVRIIADGGARNFVAFCRVDYVLEDEEEWRLRRLRIYNPIVNTHKEIDISIP